MKYTVQERKEIYMKAAKMIHESSLGYGSYICHTLEYLTNTNKNSLTRHFPEFSLFNPGTYNWFGNPGKKSANERRICLLLCAAMCDDKPEHP
jgi:hypothetical protein